MNGTYEYKLLYSGQLSPIARLNDEDRVVEEYVYGTRVNVPEYMIKDGRKYRFITDHRGSVRMVVDTHDGTVMQRTDYDEFGLIIDEDLAENWTPVLFGYAGGLQDRDTGLIRFGARDYDPMVGRWTSKEPLGFNGSDNFYVYAENDPVNKVDPDGLEPRGVLEDNSYLFWDYLIDLMRVTKNSEYCEVVDTIVDARNSNDFGNLGSKLESNRRQIGFDNIEGRDAEYYGLAYSFVSENHLQWFGGLTTLAGGVVATGYFYVKAYQMEESFDPPQHNDASLSMIYWTMKGASDAITDYFYGRK